MKAHIGTVLANAVIALVKIKVALVLLHHPEAPVSALVPAFTVLLLVIATTLTLKQRWPGPLLGALLVGFDVLYLLSTLKLAVSIGAGTPWAGYLALYVLAFVANASSLGVLRWNQREIA